MSTRTRNLTLTAHITASVGWLGAVATFLALAIAGLASTDAQLARGAYLAMAPMTWYVIVPLSFASLLTGLVQSVTTRWGVFRQYWVVAKLLLNLLSTILLLLHTRPISLMADAATRGALNSGDFRQTRIQLVVDAAAAILALLAATTLSVFKPRGLTPYGRRKEGHTSAATPRWVYASALLLATLVVLVLLLHGTGHGPVRH